MRHAPVRENFVKCAAGPPTIASLTIDDKLLGMHNQLLKLMKQYLKNLITRSKSITEGDEMVWKEMLDLQDSMCQFRRNLLLNGMTGLIPSVTKLQEDTESSIPECLFGPVLSDQLVELCLNSLKSKQFFL